VKVNILIDDTHPLAPSVLAPSLLKRGRKAACGLRGELELFRIHIFFKKNMLKKYEFHNLYKLPYDS